MSKWLKCDFRYNFIKKQFDAELLLTNTDSLTYEIKSKNVYEELLKHKQIFHFSITRTISILYFISLSDDAKESNTAKGINTATEFNEFKDTLFDKKVTRYKIKRSQGKKHKTEIYKINKTSLSCLDDKRFVLDDVIDTLSYFHKDLKK